MSLERIVPSLNEEYLEHLRFIEAKNDTVYRNGWPRIFIAIFHRANSRFIRLISPLINGVNGDISLKV